MELTDQLFEELLSKINLSKKKPPVELQQKIRGAVAASVWMIITIIALSVYVFSIFSVLFISWIIFYSIFIYKLSTENLPSRKLVKWAIILTIPFCLSLIPLMVEIIFWTLYKTIKGYEAEEVFKYLSKNPGLIDNNKHKS